MTGNALWQICNLPCIYSLPHRHCRYLPSFTSWYFCKLFIWQVCLKRRWKSYFHFQPRICLLYMKIVKVHTRTVIVWVYCNSVGQFSPSMEFVGIYLLFCYICLIFACLSFDCNTIHHAQHTAQTLQESPCCTHRTITALSLCLSRPFMFHRWF